MKRSLGLISTKIRKLHRLIRSRQRRSPGCWTCTARGIRLAHAGGGVCSSVARVFVFICHASYLYNSQIHLSPLFISIFRSLLNNSLYLYLPHWSFLSATDSAYSHVLLLWIQSKGLWDKMQKQYLYKVSNLFYYTAILRAQLVESLNFNPNPPWSQVWDLFIIISCYKDFIPWAESHFSVPGFEFKSLVFPTCQHTLLPAITTILHKAFENLRTLLLDGQRGKGRRPCAMPSPTRLTGRRNRVGRHTQELICNLTADGQMKAARAKGVLPRSAVVAAGCESQT